MVQALGAYNLKLAVINYALLLFSICVHEWAHAWSAEKLGDDLPREHGRVTLNPKSHIDLIGTVLLPILVIFWPTIMGHGGTQLALFGWGRPVNVNLWDTKNYRRNDLIVASAGPLSNLLLSFIFACMFLVAVNLNSNLSEVFYVGILMNATLFVFNIIPIPPLDGAHYIKHLFKMSIFTFFTFSRWGFLLLLVLINIPFLRSCFEGLVKSVIGIVQLSANMLISLF